MAMKSSFRFYGIPFLCQFISLRALLFAPANNSIIKQVYYLLSGTKIEVKILLQIMETEGGSRSGTRKKTGGAAATVPDLSADDAARIIAETPAAQRLSTNGFDSPSGNGAL